VPADPAAPAAPAPTASAAPAAAPEAAPPPAPPAGAAPPPAPPGPGGAPVAAPAPVPLAHAADAVHDLIQLARSRDATHARLVLHPADLGGVEVRLRHGADGLHAHVHVEHAEALAALDRGLGDLRRGLEARGVTVATLDLSLAADQQGGDTWSARGDGGFGRPSGRSRGADDGPAGPDPDPLQTAPATALRPAAGAIVDVMA